MADRAGRAERAERERPTTKQHPVGAGETLWSIARTYLDDGARYPEIVALNRDLLGDDPGFLEVGWVLQVPDIDEPAADSDLDLEDGERVVTVKPHDTLSEIADTELDDPNAYPRIFEASTDITQPGGAKLTDPDLIDVGWTLVIPAENAGHDRDDRGNRGSGKTAAGRGRGRPHRPRTSRTRPSRSPLSLRYSPRRPTRATRATRLAPMRAPTRAPMRPVGSTPPGY